MQQEATNSGATGGDAALVTAGGDQEQTIDMLLANLAPQ